MLVNRLNVFAALMMLCCFAPEYVAGQDSLSFRDPLIGFPDSVFTVGKVILSGNVETKDFVILREMTLHAGDLITRRLIDYDQNRIYSLGLFNQVKIEIVPREDTLAALIVHLVERWYVFPFPIVGIKDRDWSKWYYGFGIVHNNFRGRGEKVYTTVVFGYDPSFRLSYRNPFLNEAGTDFIEIGLGYNKVRNRSVAAQEGIDNFDEIHINGALTLGKRFGLVHTAWISTSYESVSIPDVNPPKTISADGKDQYPIFGVGYAYDTRDLREYPNYGSYVRVAITKYGFPGADYDMVRYAGDVRKFIPLLPRLVLGGRAFTDVAAAGPSPSYNHVYFGYGERIRGHFNQVLEGESIIGASTELRYSLFDPIYPRIDFLPSEFGVWRFGIALTIFGDAGTVWFRKSPLALNLFKRGYGGGINYLLPYSIVIRTEYAWDEVRNGQFIIDVGASF